MTTVHDAIALDQESGMILIPASQRHEFAIGVSVWDGTAKDAFDAFVQREAASGGLDRLSRTSGRKNTILPLTVQLVPRPDNDYNPLAISVASPPGHGGTDHDRHFGYLYERNLVSLGGPIRSLAYVTGRPVGCHAYVELHRVDTREYQECGVDYGPVIPASGNVLFGYGGLRLLLPWWEDLHRMAITYARTVAPGRILPFIGHWASWAPGARQELSARTQDPLFPITLRIEDGELLAYHQDLLLACLWPSGRDFFDRTAAHVRELGGTATAYAEDYEGSIKVYVEDSSPPTRDRPRRPPQRR
ncbi:hypothetical protein ABZ714_00500 [Streptomyces sp. NPDC006798]|uniref:hypothetical protein n=1 Tax=Streptomyces sp. NPDC006798 TaxID=3155462 RepID=UPI0033C51E6A